MYKVIKDSVYAKVGDVFLPDEKGNLVLDEEVKGKGDGEYYKSRYIVMNKNLANELVKDGVLSLIDSVDDSKLLKVSNKINELISTYDTDHKNLMDEYQKGNVQTCVKVEAETVYTNLIKVLSCLKNIINE